MHSSSRDLMGYTAGATLAGFCLLRRVLAQVVQENLLAVYVSYLVPDLAQLNESLDEQAQAALLEFLAQTGGRRS